MANSVQHNQITLMPSTFACEVNLLTLTMKCPCFTGYRASITSRVSHLTAPSALEGQCCVGRLREALCLAVIATLGLHLPGFLASGLLMVFQALSHTVDTSREAEVGAGRDAGSRS